MVSMVSNNRDGNNNNIKYDPLAPFHLETWYHGLRTRTEIEPSLQKKGDFLVRAKCSGQRMEFILCVCSQSGTNNKAAVIQHLSLFFDSKNQTWEMKTFQHARTRKSTKVTIQEFFSKQTGRQRFKSLIELINFYKVHPVVKDVMLQRAISRPKYIIPYSHVFVDASSKLGQGNFAKVLKGKYRKRKNESRIPVAVKILLETDKEIINENDDEEKNVLMKEVKVMQRYSHRNVIKFYGVVCDKPPISLIMEYCPGGALDHHLVKYGENISIGERGVFILETARGLRYLHHHQCIHRDLAARNCLISAEGFIKIADFGLSKILGKAADNGIDEDFKGSVPLRWMAPETIKREPQFSIKSDVWSYGVLVYEIFNNGIKPWAENNNNKEISKNIRHGNMPSPPERTPPSVVALLKSCWGKEIDQRPDFNDIVKKIISLQEEDPLMKIPEASEYTVNLIPGVQRLQITESTEEVLATHSFQNLNSNRDSPTQTQPDESKFKEPKSNDTPFKEPKTCETRSKEPKTKAIWSCEQPAQRTTKNIPTIKRKKDAALRE